MLGTKHRYRFDLNNDLSFDRHVGHVYPDDVAVLITDREPSIADGQAFFAQAIAQRILIDLFQESRTEEMVNLKRGLANHSGQRDKASICIRLRWSKAAPFSVFSVFSG